MEIEKEKIDAPEQNMQPVAHTDTKKKNKLVMTILTLLVVILAGGSGYYKLVYSKTHLTPDAAKAKVTDFINNNLVQPGTKIEVSSITKENGLYKVIVKVDNQEVTSYLTMDGNIFFPSAMNIDEITNKAAAAKQDASKQTKPTAEVPKSDLPEVKLFVMSYCPYGTQAQKGILPVLDVLKNKIKFSLEFVSYSMHNDKATNDRKELDENLRQYCIQKDQPTKLNAYLACFLKKGQGTETACMTSAGVSAAQTAGCMTQTDTQFDVTKNFNDESSWSGGQFPPFNVSKEDNDKYGVQGSPTLVINGVEAQSSGRDSASLLKTICSAFNNQPKECSATLSSTAPSAGFGEGTGTSAGGNASCGN